MSLGRAMHQKPGEAGRNAVGCGEAAREAMRDEARTARHETGSPGRDDLLAQALATANMVAAWKRVQSNRGSAGVDGRSIVETAEYLKTHWPRIREALLDGRYRPLPVRRVQIPKPGDGVRELGIPTVTDRLIQQALLQVLQPRIDLTFSEHSYGFRPGRRAHEAVLDAQRYVQDGYRVVVDVDLESYELWRSAGDRIKCAVARKARETFKQRIRQITRRSGGRNLPEIAERLRAYMPGWKAYFQLAQTPKVFRELDEWIRHRLRAVQLKHWRRGTTMYRELKAMGASEADARKVAANSRCWWRNSRMALNRAMPIAYFDRLGVPRLS